MSRERHIFALAYLNADIFQHNRLIIFRQVFYTIDRRIVGKIGIFQTE